MSVERNKPCSCGSGKKFKRCHGTTEKASEERTRDLTTVTLRARGSLTDFEKELFGNLSRDTAFQEMIRRIDDNLREEGIPIPDRPKAAILAARRTTETPATTTPNSHLARSGYSSQKLSVLIRRWYEKHYRGALEPAVRIQSEADFQRHIDSIDRKLREGRVPIPGRPLAALHEFSVLTRSELAVRSHDHEPTPGRYLGDDLSVRIAQWYEERYGDRILMEVVDGQVVVLLRGDPWVMELPWILGGGRETNFICGYGRPTTLPIEPVTYLLSDPAPPASDYNVLDSIKSLSPALARDLAEQECDMILESFLVGREAYRQLGRTNRDGLLSLVRGDLEAAVAHLTGRVSQTGLSLWASLQATEKILKHFLELVRGKYKHGHKLSDFETEAVASGLPPMDPTWLTAIQCSAGVRYGEDVVSLEQAVAAHHASLRVISHVLTALSAATRTV